MIHIQLSLEATSLEGGSLLAGLKRNPPTTWQVGLPGKVLWPMTISITSINIFIISLLLIFIQIKKMGSPWSRLFLSLCLAIFLISLIEVIGWLTGFFKTYPALAFWVPPFVLLMGPGMYLFTKAVLSTHFTFKKSDGLHFIPFTLALPFVQLNYQRLPLSNKIEVLDQAFNNPPSTAGLVTIVIFAIIAVYLFFSFREIKVYNARLSMEYADLRDKNVSWLSTILISFLIIFAISLIQNILRYRLPGLWNASILISSIIYIYIGSHLLFKFMEYQIPYLSSESTYKKVVKSDVDLQRLKEVTDLIDNAMETNKYFLDPDITLHTLAKMLELKPTLVSQSLNHIVKRNFFDYINKQRIDYDCHLLKTSTSKEKNITEIMYESGFNSKSSFNTAFKKYLGVTPTSYRQRLE